MPIFETAQIEGLVGYGQKGLDILLSPQLQEALFPVKIFCLICFVLFIIIAIGFSRQSDALDWQRPLEGARDALSRQPLEAKKITRKWQKIKKGVQDKSETQRKLSVIKAHSLLDEVLKRMGHSGESLAQRLEAIESTQIANIEQLKDAQKECQKILSE